MSEKFAINQERADEIEKRIKLNTFADSYLEGGTINKIATDKLLNEEDYEEEKRLSREREHFLENFSIEKILDTFLKESTFTIDQDGYIEISHTIKTELPEEYGFKGGSARSLLREVLGLRTIPPRDVDVIRLSAEEPYSSADIEIARKYMAQDFEFGDGVEPVDSISDYLTSRDFTINEVYTVGSKIVATEQCIRDTIRNVIRITKYERESYSEYEKMGPKMKAKTLRLHAEQMYSIGVSSIPEDDMSEIEKSFINPFWLAVQLDRAFERSSEIADQFTTLLIENEIVPSHIKDGVDLGHYLLSEVYDFKFRNAPYLQYKIEDDYSDINDFEETEIDLLEKYFDALHHGSKY